MSGGITFTSALNTGGVYIRYFQSPSIPVALTELESFSANLGYNLNTSTTLAPRCGSTRRQAS